MIVRGGVHTGAAAIAAIVTYLWMAQWQWRYLDATAPAALLGLAGWHAGCLWRGACLGTASELPWAWAEAGSVITRHPVELYAAIALAVGAFAVSRLSDRPFLKAGTGLAVAGLCRLLTEPMRVSVTGGPVAWYVAGIVVGVLIAALGPSISKVWQPATT